MSCQDICNTCIFEGVIHIVINAIYFFPWTVDSFEQTFPFFFNNELAFCPLHFHCLVVMPCIIEYGVVGHIDVFSLHTIGIKVKRETIFTYRIKVAHATPYCQDIPAMRNTGAEINRKNLLVALDLKHTRLFNNVARIQITQYIVESRHIFAEGKIIVLTLLCFDIIDIEIVFVLDCYVDLERWTIFNLVTNARRECHGR